MDTDDDVLRAVRFDDKGLVPAIAQDLRTGEVRMLAWQNREALRRTLETRVAHFFSRSRGALWRKGETSGNELRVRAVHLDCDGDCVLLGVEPQGPSCHTGARNCFTRAAGEGGWVDAVAVPAMEALEATVCARRDGPPVRSYTRSLLDGGAAAIGAKLREEADELARAVAGESAERVTSEAADVVFHLQVALASRGVSWRSVLDELARREGVSGLDEKASRGR